MRLGFIGVGTMGQAIAGRLIDQGHELAVHDARRDAAAALVAGGARWAATALDAAAGAEAVFLCLPGPRQVDSVVSADDGVLRGTTGGSLIVDLSTSGPTVSRHLAAMASEKGVHFIDAPISGGLASARTGLLSIAVGADEETFRRVRPLLAHIGNRVFHVGPVGSGATAKLLNNQMCFVAMMASMEALILGAKVGIDPLALRDYVSASSGASYSWEGGTKAILQDRLRPHFTTALACKDLDLAKGVADAADVPTPMADSARSELERYRDNGYADEDFMATVRALEEIADVRVRGIWPR